MQDSNNEDTGLDPKAAKVNKGGRPVGSVTIPSFVGESTGITEGAVNAIAKKPGRKPGLKAQLDAIHEVLVNSTVSVRLVNKMAEVALTDGHPAQGVMLKMFSDRLINTESITGNSSGSGNQTYVFNLGSIPSDKKKVIKTMPDGSQVLASEDTDES